MMSGTDAEALAAIAREAIEEGDEESFEVAMAVLRHASRRGTDAERLANTALLDALDDEWQEAHGPHDTEPAYCLRCEGACMHGDDPYGHDTEPPSDGQTVVMTMEAL